MRGAAGNSRSYRDHVLLLIADEIETRYDFITSCMVVPNCWPRGWKGPVIVTGLSFYLPWVVLNYKFGK